MVGIVKPVFSNWAKIPSCSQSSFTWVDPLIISTLQTNLMSLTLAFYQTRRAPHILNSTGPAGRAALPRAVKCFYQERGGRKPKRENCKCNLYRGVGIMSQCNSRLHFTCCVSELNPCDVKFMGKAVGLTKVCFLSVFCC